MAAIAQGSNAVGNAQSVAQVTSASLTATSTYNYAVIAVVLDNISAYITGVYDSLGNPAYKYIGAVNGTGVRTELWAGPLLYNAAAVKFTAYASTSCNLAISVTTYSNVYYTTAASPLGTYGPILSLVVAAANTATLTNVQQGNLIVVGVSYEAAYSAAHTLTDANLTPFVRAGHVSTGSTQVMTQEIWYGYAGVNQANGSSDLITYTSGLADIELQAMQFVNGTTTTDGSFVTGYANSGGSGTTIQPTSGITTSNANDLIICAAGTWSNAPVPGPPWNAALISSYSAMQVYLPDATGTYTPSMTQGSFSTWCVCAIALQATWSQSGVISPNTGSSAGAGTTVGSLVGSVMRSASQNTDSSGWIVTGHGWNCASGDTLTTAIFGTARGSSIPAATAAAVLLMDTNAPMNALAKIANEESLAENRNWASVSMEIRGSGGTAFSPTFPSFSAGGILPPTPGGGGQIFPVSVRAQ